jgi:quinol monooxygenase YgiN
MAGYVIIAQFDLKPGTRDQFVEIALVDARASVANEPGCQRFDVLTSDDKPDAAALYEIYDDRAAFDAHLEMPHLQAFRDGIEDLVIDRDIRIFAVDQNAKS